MIMLRFRSGLDKVLEWTLVLLMGASVINVLWQVFTRFVLQNPSSITEELARFLLIWVGVLAAGYGAGRKIHLAIDLLPMKLKGKRRRILELVIQSAIGAFAFFIMVIGGIRLVSITLFLQQTSAALQVKLGYVYLVLPLSGALIVFYTVLNIIEAVRTPPEAIEPPGDPAPGPID
jgi:TRAP-type C4-dicarboxylate transport system permease small subunit